MEPVFPLCLHVHLGGSEGMEEFAHLPPHPLSPLLERTGLTLLLLPHRGDTRLFLHPQELTQFLELIMDLLSGLSRLSLQRSATNIIRGVIINNFKVVINIITD